MIVFSVSQKGAVSLSEGTEICHAMSKSFENRCKFYFHFRKSKLTGNSVCLAIDLAHMKKRSTFLGQYAEEKTVTP